MQATLGPLWTQNTWSADRDEDILALHRRKQLNSGRCTLISFHSSNLSNISLLVQLLPGLVFNGTNIIHCEAMPTV